MNDADAEKMLRQLAKSAEVGSYRLVACRSTKVGKVSWNGFGAALRRGWSRVFEQGILFKPRFGVY